MKRCLGFLMVIAGLAMIVFTFGSFFANARLIASNCNLKCGQDNRICRGISRDAYCPCFSQEHSEGKYYANVPTSGSVTGYSIVEYESIICKGKFICDPIDPQPDKECRGRIIEGFFTPLYSCEDSAGSTCPEYQVKVFPTQYYSNCVSHSCEE